VPKGNEKPKRAARVVGLCGAVGSGKSAVAHIMRELGACVIDADAIAHEMLEDIEVKQSVKRRWGQTVLDERGRVDRRKLGEKVFSSSEELRELEKLIHPRVRARMLKDIEAARRDPQTSAVVIDAPLILEAGLDSWCDTLVFVDAPHAVRLARVARRHGWDQAEMDRRERSQLPVEEKRKRADHVLENASSMDELRRRVEEIYPRLVGE
jgi:dephospho-CoA kinase